MNLAPPDSAKIFVMAAVNDVLPWSTWPMVPILQCGLFRSNFAFDMCCVFLFLLKPTVRLTRFDGAGDGNRTHIASLEGWSFTTKLHPHKIMVERAGFEPT